jgi:protein disulfide-isomerase A1
MFGVANAEDTWEDGVLVLGDSNFDEAIAKYDYLLVEFYAPWCGHCKKLTPEYAAAAQKLAALDPPRYLAKVDATEHKEVAERHDVKGFPTLVFYNQGTKSEYTGGRTEDTIVSWITKKTGPPSTEVDCATMVTKTSEDKLALSYFGESAGALWDAFFGAAKDPVIGEKYSFYHTADVACGEKFDLSGSGVALSRRFDDSPLQYSGDQTTEALVNWGTSSSVPILITFSDDYVEPIFQAGNPAIILFTEETATHKQVYVDTFAQAAKDLNGEILFVTSGVSEGI